MVEAYVKAYKNLIIKDQKSIGTQTGATDCLFYLNKTKTIILYHSQVYRERVLSLNLSASKSYIMNETLWKELKKHINQIDLYFKDGNKRF
jgi:hypothetical protein